MLFPHTKRTAISLAVASACTVMVMQAHAQTEAPAETSLETVVVKGVRASLEKSVQLKRASIGTRDTIVAEDIGKFPEANIADAMSRLPGVEVERDPENGEGGTIRMRGLGSNYTVTTFNGAPVRATAGTNVGNSKRDFNYDIFPSELFSRVDVTKTPMAILEEGGAAGVVNMGTPRPFDYKGQKISYSVTGTKKDGQDVEPKANVLYSNTWGKFGFLVQGTVAQSSQGAGGARNNGQFMDSREGVLLVPRSFSADQTAFRAAYRLANPSTAVSSQPGFVTDGTINTLYASTRTYRPSFSYKWDWRNLPATSLNGLTGQALADAQASINNGFLPRIMQISSSGTERERVGMNTSLQYKDSKTNVSFDTLLANLKTEYNRNMLQLYNRDLNHNSATEGIFTNPQGWLVPINMRVDQNNNLSGTLGNVGFEAVSFWNVSETDFTYNSLQASHQFTDSFKISGQLTANKSVAYKTQAQLVATSDAGYAVGSGLGATFPTRVTTNLTLDYSDPVLPTLSTSRNLADRAGYFAFTSNSSNSKKEIDEQQTAKLDGEYTYEVGESQGIFKAGVSSVESKKTLEVRNLGNNGLINPLLAANLKKSDGNALDNNLANYALNSQRAAIMQQYMTTNSLASKVPGDVSGFPLNFATFDKTFITDKLNAQSVIEAQDISKGDSYETTEKITALYVQNDFETQLLGRKLRTNVGVRHVSTEMNINQTQPSKLNPLVPFVPVSFSNTYTDTLPSASAAYDIVKDVVLRASWGQTITRPSVSLLAAPYTVQGNGGDLTVKAGNPNLLPEKSESLDLGVEWYFDKGGIVALQAYQKTFKDYLRTTTTSVEFVSLGLAKSQFTANNFTGPKLDNPDTQLISSDNGGQFKIEGIEIAYQQSFKKLPAPFNGMGFYGSFTKNKTDGFTRTYLGVAYELPRVPETSYSAALYYEQGDLFLRGTYNWKSEYANADDNGTNAYGFQRWFNARGTLDASVGYKFSKALELRVDATNLTNTKTYDFFRNFEGRFGDEESRVDNANILGRGFSINLRGTF